MSWSNARSLARVCVIGVAASMMTVGVMGCKSQKDRAEGQATYQLRQLRSDLERAPKLIDLTTESLVAATTGQNPQRAADVKQLQARIDDLQASTKRLSSEVIAAKGDSDRFFREWAKEANRTSGGTRTVISDEMATRRANRDRALGYLNSADKAYASYVSQLEAVEASLLADPSEAAVQRVQGTVSTAIADGNKAKEFLLRVIEQVDTALGSAQ